jgi:hypothetical protein
MDRGPDAERQKGKIKKKKEKYKIIFSSTFMCPVLSRRDRM